jgi:aerobic-type carbon monoxide dehydrogenase small subunit (CoxS/CutS family)
MKLNVTINGVQKTFEIHPGEILLDLLRREGYRGVKRGCQTGECGACAILLDGRAVNACIMLAAQAEGREITTIEGIGTPEKPHPLQVAFAENGAVQCGYCTPGMIVSAKALLDENPDPTGDEVRDVLAGNLCRCTGYVKPIEAVLAAARTMRGEAK